MVSSHGLLGAVGNSFLFVPIGIFYTCTDLGFFFWTYGLSVVRVCYCLWSVYSSRLFFDACDGSMLAVAERAHISKSISFVAEHT